MAEIARGKRFSLLGVDGVTIDAEVTSRGRRESGSYCIVDRAWNHKEVWSDYTRALLGNHGNVLNRRQRALAKLDEFEAWAAEVEAA